MPDQSLLSTVRSDLSDERDRLESQIAALEPGGGSDFDDNFADSGQVAAEQGENMVLAQQLRTELDEVDRALGKLDDGTWEHGASGVGAVHRCRDWTVLRDWIAATPPGPVEIPDDENEAR